MRAESANPLRSRVGLRQIGQTWICFRSNHGKDEWLINPNDRSADKCVQYDLQGKLLWENDSYFSGHSIWIDGQTVQEQILIHYDYIRKNVEIWYIGNDPTVDGLVDTSSGALNVDVFAAADKILKFWGTSRL